MKRISKIPGWALFRYFSTCFLSFITIVSHPLFNFSRLTLRQTKRKKVHITTYTGMNIYDWTFTHPGIFISELIWHMSMVIFFERRKMLYIPSYASQITDESIPATDIIYSVNRTPASCLISWYIYFTLCVANTLNQPLKHELYTTINN